jgi:dihydrofolate reductase
MDWIRIDDELVEYVEQLTADADAAIFGRVTYQLMEGYWPTAAASPSATKHDIDHSRWVNSAIKFVFSRTLQDATWGKWNNVRLVRDNFAEELRELKQQPGKNLLMIGSAGLAQAFMRLGLIDEYRINVNPVVLGGGKPLFHDTGAKINLKLVESRTFKSGVVGLHYGTVNES